MHATPVRPTTTPVPAASTPPPVPVASHLPSRRPLSTAPTPTASAPAAFVPPRAATCASAVHARLHLLLLPTHHCCRPLRHAATWPCATAATRAGRPHIGILRHPSRPATVRALTHRRPPPLPSTVPESRQARLPPHQPYVLHCRQIGGTSLRDRDERRRTKRSKRDRRRGEDADSRRSHGGR